MQNWSIKEKIHRPPNYLTVYFELEKNKICFTPAQKFQKGQASKSFLFEEIQFPSTPSSNVI